MDPGISRSFLFFCLIMLVVSCKQAVVQEEGPGKPNIIYIMADDLGYGDVGVYGQTRIKTPNIDRLAAEGMRFTRHYAGSTVCAPSRCVLMTGLYTGHARIRGNARVPLQPEDTTVAEVLKSVGYRTALIGKWGLGEPESTGIPNRQGFDYFYGYLNQAHAHNSYPEYLWENETRDSLDNIVELFKRGDVVGPGGVATVKKTHSHDAFMAKALDFIRENKDTSFFLYLPFTLPHANNEARHWDSIGMEVPDLGIYAGEDWPRTQKAHAAMITYLDKGVGEIIEALKANGLGKNTLVIFTSDNGPHDEGGADHAFFDSNGPLRGLKRDLYEGGIRVPMIAWWPGRITAGQVSDHISAFWDVLPTLCELTGAKTPQGLDGISYLPTLFGRPQPAHEFMYWEFYEQGGKKAVLFGNWKLIALNVNKPEEMTWELYDLTNDLGEAHNLADQHPDLVKKGQEMMDRSHVYSADFHFEGE
ncbi:MAG TPA: arylsulfatase [Flavilitoribacter sp.]|nr:arylsulfatase [Flavilitoribacter sp.]